VLLQFSYPLVTGSTVTTRTTEATDALTSASFAVKKFKKTACEKNGAMASHKRLICQWPQYEKRLIF
jgi:hypothetical protein